MSPNVVEAAPAVLISEVGPRDGLQSVLRQHYQGADTIVWLADARPQQQVVGSIWFDRKERPAHIYAHTPKSTATGADLLATLESYVLPRDALA